MAIFSRRSLQRIIDENASFITPRQTADLVRKLDDRGHLVPDSIRALLDKMHESRRNCAELKTALKCERHLFQRTLIIPGQEQPETVCEQKVVNS